MPSLHQRVTRALDLLTREVSPFVEERLQIIYRERWDKIARESFRKDRSLPASEQQGVNWDAQSLLTVMWDQWNSVFRHKLGHTERSLVSELREFRNQWAHQNEFNFDDTYRVLDSVQRLIQVIAPDALEEISHQKRDLLREEFTEELRLARARANIKWRLYRDVTAYVICAGALVFAIFNTFGAGALTWWASFSVLIIFAYFIYEAVTFEAPIFGPHECVRCTRIIYSEPCPYCTPHYRTPPPVIPSAEMEETETEQ